MRQSVTELDSVCDCRTSIVQPRQLLGTTPFPFGRLTVGTGSVTVAAAMSQTLGHGFGFSSYVRLVERWLSRYTPATQAAYRQAFLHWAEWVGDDALAVAVLTSRLSLDQVLRRYERVLGGEGRSPTKIRQHLAALRSLRAFPNRLWQELLFEAGGDPEAITGMDAPRLSVELLHAADQWIEAGSWKKLDRSGPEMLSEAQSRELLEKTEDARDRAILALMLYLRLTPAKIAALDHFGDEWDGAVDPVEVQVGWDMIGKWPLPSAMRRPLHEWLEERGNTPGPLFLSRDRAHEGNRLSVRSINRLTHDAGARIGISDFNPRLLKRAGRPGSSEALKQAFANARQAQEARAARLLDYDASIEWPEWLGGTAHSYTPHGNPPWAWREANLQLMFARRVEQAASKDVTRGFQDIEWWDALMGLLVERVPGFAPPVNRPTPPKPRSLGRRNKPRL